MPHLDEGMLHAYLDDAISDDVAKHLRECVECRADLEKARLLKESADTILSNATPVGVAMPSFEELRARAKSRSENGQTVEDKPTVRQQHSFSQFRALAWAATVVLAVAVGWYARSTVLQTGREQFVSEDEQGGRLTIPLPETGGTEMEESLQTANIAEGATVQDAPDVVAGVANATDQGEAVEARRVRTPEATEPAGPEREALAVSVVPPQRARVEPTVTTVSAAAGETRQEQQTTSSVASVQSQIFAERSLAAPTEMPAALGRGGDAEGIWTTVEKATAERILDRSVPTVEGLPVVGYAASSINGKQVIRVLQSLESGQLLELVITQVDDADLPPDAKKGMGTLDSVNTVDVARGNMRIRLSAALATDSLWVLAQYIPSNK